MGASIADLDLAPPKAWRRLLPRWLRALVWLDSSDRYDAFLSYSWKSDSQVAPLVQSVIHRFLCPWYKPRARSVFRDLSCLPAGTSLEAELRERLDRSRHLIVLASTDAASSRGMEIEARHWFGRARDGQVVIIVTSGSSQTWESVRDNLLPPAVRSNLTNEPLWIPLQHRRGNILSNTKRRRLIEDLTEDLKQILLRFHPGRDWGQLRGEERARRRRALALLLGTTVLFVMLTVVASGLAIYARRQAQSAESRLLALEAEHQATRDRPKALDMAIKAWQLEHTDETRNAVRAIFPSPLFALVDDDQSTSDIAFSPDGQRVATVSDRLNIWDPSSGVRLAAAGKATDRIRGVAFSGDSQRIVTGASARDFGDYPARIWRASDGQDVVVALVGHNNDVRDASFSPDGRRIVAAGSDGTARIWDAATGNMIRVLSGSASDHDVTRACYSPDGRLILTAGFDSASIAKIWNSDSGELLATLRGHSSYIDSAAFSPDGKRVVTASGDKTARVWSVPVGKLLAELTGHSGPVVAALFSPNGELVVTASGDKTARVWNANTGAPVSTLSGHDGEVGAASFTPDSRFVATADDHGARIWNVATGQLLAVFAPHAARRVVFDPEGQRLLTASGGKEAGLWSTMSFRLVATLSVPVESLLFDVAFSSDGQRVLTTSLEGYVKVWSSSTGQWLETIGGDRNTHAEFSPDGRDVVTASDDGTVRIWNTSGYSTVTLSGHTGSVEYATFTPDGRHVVTASHDHTARIWEADTGRLAVMLSGHEGPVYQANASPDGRLVVTASDDNSARVWELSSGRQLAVLSAHTGWVRVARFSPDGGRIVTVDRTAVLWSSAGKQLAVLTGHSGPVEDAAFSPDGQRLVTAGDQTARLWDAWNGRELSVLAGHSGGVVRAKFSPDGQYVITTSFDNTARLWNSSNGQLLAILGGHVDVVLSAAFSPDSRSVVTASRDGTARLYRLVTLPDIEALLAR